MVSQNIGMKKSIKSWLKVKQNSSRLYWHLREIINLNKTILKTILKVESLQYNMACLWATRAALSLM